MAITLTNSATGRKGKLVVAGNTIAITKWSGKLVTEYADGTDSANYDAVTGNTWASQQPGVTHTEGTIEGNYDLSNTSTNITSKIKTPGPYAATFGLTDSVNWGSGNIDLTDVEVSVEIPGSTMITFSANWKSSGVFTLS